MLLVWRCLRCLYARIQVQDFLDQGLDARGSETVQEQFLFRTNLLPLVQRAQPAQRQTPWQAGETARGTVCPTLPVTHALGIHTYKFCRYEQVWGGYNLLGGTAQSVNVISPRLQSHGLRA